MSLRIQIVLFILVLLSTSCMGRERMREQEDTVKAEDTARYYRPIHHEHRDWRMSKDGGRFELKTKDERLVFSVRQGAAVIYESSEKMVSSEGVDVSGSDGKSIVVRQAGKVIAEIVSNKGVIYYINRRLDAPNQGRKADYLARCFRKDRIEVYDKSQAYFYDFTPREASSVDRLFRQVSARKQSVAPISQTDGSCCRDSELDTPLSPLGTALLYSENLPLDWRAGLAIYVSRFEMVCP